ncbi:hypothetical protein [Halobaculum roseum]|uniref:Outer membrane lipoprotein-sorting protein n=1 Tax=Halobaculum roseum TaxID=2175149 RepID=A0ABD5MLW0_9EURY|nr:hypothetical protein [Halobaculum roseum]QZY03807.1 hypothetical protein K6T36_06500 [Halobaculum roseum]
MRRAVLAFVVAVAVLLAGCGAGPGDGGARTVNPALANTPTASPTPTPAPEYPPGVGDDGVDARVLAGNHDSALDRVNSTVLIDRTVVGANGTTVSATDIRIESAGSRVHYRVNQTGGLPAQFVSPFPTFEFWTDGNVTVTRAVDASGNVTLRRITGQPPTIADADDTGEDSVFGRFVGTNARLVGTTTVDGEEAYVVRADHDALDRRGGPPMRDYRLNATVTEAGVVLAYDLTFTATYETEDGGTLVATTTERFRTTVGGSAASPPPWVRDSNASTAGGADTADGESEPTDAAWTASGG